MDSSDAKILGAESPSPVKLLPKNSRGDLSPSATDEIGTTLGLISITSAQLWVSTLGILNPYLNWS